MGEQNEAMEAKGKEPLTLDKFKITDEYIPEPIENALHSLKVKIDSIEEYAEKKFGIEALILVMGGKDNFRDHLDLPKRYKWNREGTHKPIHLPKVREYLRDVMDAEITDGQEADDTIGEYAVQGYKDYLDTGIFSYMQIVEDKDADQYPGLTLNPRKDIMGWVHPEGKFIDDGLGSLEMIKGKCKGVGFKWLCFQCFGDCTDGYNCTKSLGLRYGDKGKFDLLDPLETKQDCLRAVLKTYKEKFGERVQYTSGLGNEMDITYQAYLELHFQCAYMKVKGPKDPTTFKSICEEYGVEY